MENIIWFLIMGPCSALFTGIGVYAWKRKKPGKEIANRTEANHV